MTVAVDAVDAVIVDADGVDVTVDLGDTAAFLAALGHPRAEAGFASDFAAMQRADAIVAVAP